MNHSVLTTDPHNNGIGEICTYHILYNKDNPI